MKELFKEFQQDTLKVKIFSHEKAMGESAAEFVAYHINLAIKNNNSANLILATGTSQFAFLDALQKADINWKKVSVFHLDEYKGISDNHHASFRKYLKERIINIVKPGNVFLIEGDAENPEDAVSRYEALLKDHPIDIACIGIGENGHIAFNDPPVADFFDTKLVKIVELDEACRKQQLGEGWFPTMDDVPKEALTLTIPAIMSCKTISCFVPGERKARAIHNTLSGPINTSCPASILRNHPDSVLFLDSAAASLI